MFRPNRSVNNFFPSWRIRRSTASIQSCRQTASEKLSQPLIQSWCQKVVGGHLPLLEELIIFPEGKFTHHQLANNHVAGSTRSARPLSYRRLQQYSPAHIAAAPSRLTSSFVKQARRYQDDQKVSFMFHDSFCCGKEQPVRSNNNFSAVEAGAIQIGPAPWKPVLYKLAHHRRGKPAINKLALDTLKLKVNRPRTASCLGFRRTIFLQRWASPIGDAERDRLVEKLRVGAGTAI